MTWLKNKHECSPPTHELAESLIDPLTGEALVDGWCGIWMCSECGIQFEVNYGGYFGAYAVTILDDGTENRRPTFSWRKISRSI